MDLSSSGFIDINSDSIKEIILIDRVGEKLTGCSIQIYSYKNNKLELITPYDIITFKGIEYKSTKIINCKDISDIDGDGNIEITTEEVLFQTNINGEIEELRKVKIWKFNGIKYFLWKEEVDGK